MYKIKAKNEGLYLYKSGQLIAKFGTAKEAEVYIYEQKIKSKLMSDIKNRKVQINIPF